MPSAHDKQRRVRLAEVLTLIRDRTEFAKSEIQSLCQESHPAFVTKVLKQLTAEGILRTDPRDADNRFEWSDHPSRFVPEHWIERQVVGGQVNQAPIEERPRERLLSQGAGQLTVADLLAILIRSGRQGESAIQAAQKVANRTRDCLHGLPDISREEMREISKAITEAGYCQIMAGIELGRRVAQAVSEQAPPERINGAEAAKAYCARHFARLAADARHEEFHIVTLDTKLQPIQRHRITVGTLDASLVHPREVFRAAIRDAASSILLVHNHPSGNPTPSRQDHEVTDRLRESGKIIGIHVVDHIIVTPGHTVSITESKR